MNEHHHGVLARLAAILRQRCPRCLTGPVFKGFLSMHEPCPHCGLTFQREEGYFLGAMYVSYVLGAAVVGILWLAASLLWPNVHPITLCLCIFAAYVPLMPVVYRYARVVWMHFDRLVCPGETAAGAYQKSRTPPRSLS